MESFPFLSDRYSLSHAEQCCTRNYWFPIVVMKPCSQSCKVVHVYTHVLKRPCECPSDDIYRRKLWNFRLPRWVSHSRWLIHGCCSMGEVVPRCCSSSTPGCCLRACRYLRTSFLGGNAIHSRESFRAAAQAVKTHRSSTICLHCLQFLEPDKQYTVEEYQKG